MILKAFWIECDNRECRVGYPPDLGEKSVAHLRDFAKRTGWKRINGHDYCPQCAEEHKAAER
jgi:hypothetical protein